jgi:hypothetical protein
MTRSKKLTTKKGMTIIDPLDLRRAGERESVLPATKTARWTGDWWRLRRRPHSWRGCSLRITEVGINSHTDMLISSRSRRKSMRIHNMLAGMINLWGVSNIEVVDLIVKAHLLSTNQEVVR